MPVAPLLSPESGLTMPKSTNSETLYYSTFTTSQNILKSSIGGVLLFSAAFNKSVYRVGPPNVTRIWIKRLFGQAKAVWQFLPFPGYVWWLHSVLLRFHLRPKRVGCRCAPTFNFHVQGPCARVTDDGGDDGIPHISSSLSPPARNPDSRSDFSTPPPPPLAANPSFIDRSAH